MDFITGNNKINSQVRADDRDPPETGGKVTYKFVSTPGEKERFHVDPESGRISTADVSIKQGSIYDISIFT